MSDKVQSCKSCGASIIFMTQKSTYKNQNPKANPINRSPSLDGNLLVNFDTLTYQIVPKKELEKLSRLPKPPTLYKSHFSNCKDSDYFRKGK